MRLSYFKALVVLMCSWSVLLSQAWAASSPRSVDLSAITSNIERTMSTFDIPGIAVAIVKDDKVVMAKGFGVRKLGEKHKIDADTLFGIASNTKAFTVAAIGILVDEGKLDWDDKVTDYLPKFQLYDPYVTREFTIVDMLSHRSGLGLGAGDLMIWPASDIDNDEIIERMRYLEPVSSFRSQYAYNNLMYVMAGEVVAKVSGMSWQSFVHKRILMPLKMNDTRMNYSLIAKDNRNVATPHAPVDGVLKPVGGDFLQNFSAAGSMASNVNDIAKWLRVQLKGGLVEVVKSEEKRVFSELQQMKMWAPVTVQTVDPFLEEMNKTQFKAYGMGWGVLDHHGYKMVGHTGGIMGMVSRVVLVPEANLAVVVLTNQQSGSAFNAIANDIVNRYLGIENKDWVSIYNKRLQKKVRADKSTIASLMSDRAANSKPTLPLVDFAQTYKDNWYGDIDIKLTNDNQLEMRFSRTKSLVGVLEHYQHNTFIVRWYDRSTNADAFVHFQLNSEGEVEQARMKAVSSRTDFSFDFHDLLLKPKF